MWALRNRTAYSAERGWVRDKTGVHEWVVCVKATFIVNHDGSVRLADEQPPPLHTPVHFGEPGLSSLRYEADLGLMKPATDVTILADAWAPRERPVESVIVSLRTDSLVKSLRVYGERSFERGLWGVAPGRPYPFVHRPIRYEHAFGGSDLSDSDTRKHCCDRRNPIGCGFATHPHKLAGQLAPSIEYPHGDAARTGPAGFGPLASHWLPRLNYAGTYDSNWERTKRPLLPDDFDPLFTLCTPADQRLPQYLRGGELIELVNLTPSGRLSFSLPKLCLTFNTHFGSHRMAHIGQLVSVVIEPAENKLAMIWQTTLRVPAWQTEYLDQTVIWERPG
jgi:hypothetical protein